MFAAAASRLEKAAVERLCKPAALYVPSGTMSNLIAIGTRCRRGDEAICGDEGGMGVSLHAVPNQRDGTLGLMDINNAVRDDDPQYPRARLVEIKITQNACNGRGRRSATSRSFAMNATCADSVSFCLSKGLDASVGSIRASSSIMPLYSASRSAAECARPASSRRGGSTHSTATSTTM
ncbi:hypothetical protein PF003_g28388 [Phytophthora fragariae]|nr:hypothetical protein PF003_g28388 [Phytophthora fragariae]